MGWVPVFILFPLPTIRGLGPMFRNAKTPGCDMHGFFPTEPPFQSDDTESLFWRSWEYRLDSISRIGGGGCSRRTCFKTARCELFLMHRSMLFL
ncbi:hypothetical protein L207DRAFT_19035 [Hyaloscypha variabilis F]|uniref:Secreted protein n=1 Tax=Hyaloscypha variabilis (strain UAMH 11265 / GT02V1 / F) TaxID=1149755 RepID=A0A2J6SDT2_HYAVF|nr:hypothetical protein L207DRAFT_19035 [Hyaloscypha variabilis F]